MHIYQIMQTDIITVRAGTPLRTLLGSFKEFHSFPLVPVVDEERHLVGIVHIKSLFEIFQPYHQQIVKHNPLSMVLREPVNIFDIDIDDSLGFLIIAADIMDTKILSVDKDAHLKDTYQTMQLNKREFLPVVDAQHRLVGMVGLFDIVKAVFTEKGLLEA